MDKKSIPRIFLSGNPRSGKTTLIERVIENIGKENFIGFYSKEVLEDSRRKGFDIYFIDKGNLFITPLARTNVRTNYKIGKYYVIIENIDKVSSILIKRIDYDEKKIFVVDEIGRMEFLSKNFQLLVKKILNKNVPIIATVHRNFLHIVPNYIWLNRYKWWDVYKKVLGVLKDYLYDR